MPRLVLAALFVAAVVLIGAVVARSVSRLFEADGETSSQRSGDAMQRVAFLLLLALMAYAIMSGTS
jgi:hypothetical protein